RSAGELRQRAPAPLQAAQLALKSLPRLMLRALVFVPRELADTVAVIAPSLTLAILELLELLGAASCGAQLTTSFCVRHATRWAGRKAQLRTATRQPLRGRRPGRPLRWRPGVPPGASTRARLSRAAVTRRRSSVPRPSGRQRAV